MVQSWVWGVQITLKKAEVKNGMPLATKGNRIKYNSEETKKDLDYLDLEQKRVLFFNFLSCFVFILIHNKQSSIEIIVGIFRILEMHLL